MSCLDLIFCIFNSNQSPSPSFSIPPSLPPQQRLNNRYEKASISDICNVCDPILHREHRQLALHAKISRAKVTSALSYSRLYDIMFYKKWPSKNPQFVTKACPARGSSAADLGLEWLERSSGRRGWYKKVCVSGRPLVHNQPSDHAVTGPGWVQNDDGRLKRKKKQWIWKKGKSWRTLLSYIYIYTNK